MVWDPGHPFRWRTWLRGRLPWPLINLGFAAKGEDCERVGGSTTGTTSTIELAAATMRGRPPGSTLEEAMKGPRGSAESSEQTETPRRSSAVATGFGYPKPAGDCGQGGADVERQRQTESLRGDREATADATLEDAQERLVLLAKIERGLAELDAGQGSDHAEVKRRLLR